MNLPPPTRTSVPLLLLLFGIAFMLTNYVVLLSADVERARQSVMELARSQSARLSGLATSSTKSEQVQRLTNDLGYLNEDPELKFAIISDPDLRILRSSAEEWEGRALETTPAAYVRDVLDIAFDVETTVGALFTQISLDTHIEDFSVQAFVAQLR